MCPKPFSWAKNKRKLFSDGKSRGPLLAIVALKQCRDSRRKTKIICLVSFHLIIVSIFTHKLDKSMPGKKGAIW